MKGEFERAVGRRALGEPHVPDYARVRTHTDRRGDGVVTIIRGKAAW
jgi:hypothetical protein